MRYTQPTILKVHNAISAIQHVGDPDPSKPLKDIPDSAVNPTQLTDAAAYEADE